MQLTRSRFHFRRYLSFVPLAAVLAVSTGCDALGPNEDLAGFYNYAGTVYNSPGRSVNGQLNITRPFGNEADVDVDWNFYEGSQRVVHVESSRDVPAQILNDGTIRFTVEGSLQLSDGTFTNFTLTHDGRRSGSRGLKGTWRLLTDLPSDDSGTFTASR
jgi:hypothetical protein